jgi:hypothetical protein
MKRYIVASSIKNASSLVNSIGKYLKKNIDGAYNIRFSSNTCEVTIRMYYQVEGDIDTFSTIDFLLNITSYQNKVRVNITEDTAMEKTIGQIILTDTELADFRLAKKKILTKIKRFIDKEYADYIFVY